MKIRLRPGERLSTLLTIEVQAFDEETVTLHADGVEVKLRYDDAATQIASVVSITDEIYIFQGGSKSLEFSPRPRTRPRSGDYGQRDRRPDRPTSSPSARAATEVEVFFSFRFAPLETEWKEVDIELEPEGSEAFYNGRLGFLIEGIGESGVLLRLTDPFAEQVMNTTAEIGDQDVVEAVATVVTHTSKQFALQGLGEVEEGYFRFRVAEFYYSPEDQDTQCKRCQ